MELKRILIVLGITTFLLGCMKEEIPVPLPPPGDVRVGQVSMMNDYRYQVYFNLKKGEYVSQNFKTDWDLGFECGVDGRHVILNGSKLMFAAKSGETDFSGIKDTLNNYVWKADAVTGHLDSTAVGNWTDHNMIYIIDRGYDEKGIHQGIYKILFKSYDDQSFTVEIARLTENKGITVIIPKVDGINYNYLSFENGGEVRTLEPEKTNYDLIFTQYTESLLDGENYIPYLVTGAQLNRYNTTAVLDEETNFDDITLESIVNYEFSPAIDKPGYNWKVFSLSEGSYTIFPEKIYIIRSNDGFFYKLRFIDFYNETGERGYPKFEYQQL